MNKTFRNVAILKNIIITVLVIAFFVGIILTYYGMLYDAKREIIIKNGETTAKETAERFDDYLSTSIDAIKFTAYTVEGMIAENESNPAIHDYLTSQTVAIKNAVFENTSGLYGYINGEFMIGIDWEPPEGFVATERPWYKKAIEKNGEIAMIEPYLDLQTGTVLMSISKMLKDGKSAVSMDITLDIIQKITEDSVSEGKSDIQMIIDRNGYVVAHSDKSEIGKDYSSETDCFGSEIINQLKQSQKSDKAYFEFYYNNTQYIVYAAELQHDFLCISAKDASAIFTPLITILILTVAAVVIVVTIILLIMMISNKKQHVMERLGQQLSATADIYISMHEINFLTDTFIEVRNKKRAETSSLIGDTRTHCQETLRSIMTQFSDPAWRETVLDFVDFSKLNLRLKDRNTMILEWLNNEKKWRRSRYIVSDRTPTGMIARAIYLIEDIDAEKSERDITLEALKMMNTQISSVANIYFSMYDIDLINDTFREIKTHASRVSGLIADPISNAQQNVFESIKRSTNEVSRNIMYNFVDFSTLDERLSESNTITEEFLNSNNIWCRARFVVSKCSIEGKLEHVLWLVESIDEEKRKRDLLSKAAQTLTSQLSSAADIYISLCDLNIPENSVTSIKNENPAIAKAVDACNHNMQEIFFGIMKGLPESPTKQSAIDFCDLSNIDKKLRGKNTMSVEYLSYGNIWVRGRYVVSERDKNGRITHLLWMLENIDKEKKDREKLIDMSERALAANEAKSSFLSNMSHEIRTPINAVLGMNEMILRECDDQNILEYSNSIKTAGSTLLGIVNDILDFSKIEAGKMEIIPVDYDISSVINDLVSMIQTKADNKGLHLILDISRDIPKQLHGDEVRIKQVITNILTNAVKYTEEGSVTFFINSEKIPDEPDSIMLNVSVKDTGIGIKKEDMTKLFSEFERIEEARNRKVEGTGLGMSITKRLLEMMGSTLEVESIYKLGSKFSFRLKQKVVKWDELGDYETAYRESLGTHNKYHEKFRAPTATVLVVDDTLMNLMVFKSLLKQTGVQIDTASSGDEGIELACSKKYDLIFLDHMMPEKDGIETFHEIRSHIEGPNLKTPTICLTANAISGAREKYLSEGFDDYLTKPIDSDRLEEMLVEYLPADKIHDPDEFLDTETSDVTDNAPLSEDMELPGFLTKIDELDTEKGIANNGSVESYMETLLIYAETIDDIAAETEEYWLSGDLENATTKIHAMKSTSRIIGATDIGELAQELENAGKNGDRDKVAERIDELFERCRKLSKQLSPLIYGEEE